MPRFYFDTKIGPDLHVDHEGEEYSDPESAILVAKLAAAEYAADKVAHGQPIDHEEKLVRNEYGEVIDQFMLIDALSTAMPPTH